MICTILNFTTYWRTRQLASTLLPLSAVFVAIVGTAIAEEQKGYCWVPVKNGEPTEADLNTAHRMLGTSEFKIPGMTGPVYTPVHRDGRWMITSDARFVLYDLEFPNGFWDEDQWVYEPVNKRVVAATMIGADNLLQLGEGDTAFEAIETIRLHRYGPEENRRWGSTEFFQLERPAQTVVETCNNETGCLLYRIEGDTLAPWLKPSDAATLGWENVRLIEKTDDNRMSIIVTFDEERNNSLVYVSLDAQPYQSLGELGEGRVVFRGQIGAEGFGVGTPRRVVRVKHADDVIMSDSFDIGRTQGVSGPFGAGSYLRWTPETWLSSGRVDILLPDSSEWTAFFSGDEEPFSRRLYPKPAKSLETYYFWYGDQMYLFDGITAVGLTLDGQEWHSNGHGWLDAPTLGRFLLLSKDTIYSVSPDGSLEDLGIKLMSNIDPFTGEDDPYLGAVTFRAGGQLHALWPDLDVTELSELYLDQTDPLAPASPLDVAPWPGVKVSTKDNQLWLRIDLAREHAPSCGVLR